MARRRVVILGSGFGAVYTYKRLHERIHGKLDDVEIVIVSRDNYFLFTPMLHEVATGELIEVMSSSPFAISWAAVWGILFRQM